MATEFMRCGARQGFHCDEATRRQRAETFPGVDCNGVDIGRIGEDDGGGKDLVAVRIFAVCASLAAICRATC